MRAASTCLCLVGLGAGCNPVLGLDRTELVDETVRSLVFDNSASRVDLVDFPVLVALDPTKLRYEQVVDPTTQLAFVDPDSGQELAFEIERWDPTGRSDIWVNVPQIDAGSTTDHILMLLGADAGGREQPAGVWSSFEFVYHGVPGDLSSSIGAFPGTATAVATTAGAIASAPRFSGGDRSSIEFANTEALFAGWDRFTLELWLYPDYPPGSGPAGEPQFFTMDGPITLGRVRSSDSNIETLLNMQADFHFDTGSRQLWPSIQRAGWVYVVYSFDGHVLWLYRNGGLADLDASDVARRLRQLPGQLTLGSTSTAFAGMLDEVRVSRTSRDADWVNAQFLSMTGKFVTFVGGGGG